MSPLLSTTAKKSAKELCPRNSAPIGTTIVKGSRENGDGILTEGLSVTKND